MRKKRDPAARANSAEGVCPKNALLLIVSFALVVLLLGGSSKYEEAHFALLRPLAALFLGAALWHSSAESIRGYRFHFILLFALALWTALQLVPLPPVIWQALPDREVLAKIDVLLGLEGHWRPISFVPSRTLNALASLIVPGCALLLVLVHQRSELRLVILLLVAGMGVLDAVLGIGQVLTGRDSLLYLYGATNDGAPAGIFANENHSAAFSVISMLVIARLATTPRVGAMMRWIRFAAGPAFLLVFLCVLVSGSRAGLALAALSLMAVGLMFWIARRVTQEGYRPTMPARGFHLPRQIIFPFLGAGVATSLLVYFLFERTPAFEDLVQQSAFEDLRLQIAPVLGEMMSNFWLLGAGFGTFEDVYHIYEPTALLIPHYVNQAHNDLAQLVIEGGLPATILLLLLMAWILSAVRALIIRRGTLILGIFWMTVVIVLAAASLVDYPLRKPIFQVLGVWLVVLLAEDRRVLE